jgi:hypothetical protein
MPTLTLGFLSKFQVHTRFMMCVMKVMEELKVQQTEWQPKLKMIMGKSHLGHGRSVIVTEWYDDPSIGDEDAFFFLDADHTFTTEDILRVARQEGDLNAGIYVNYHDDPTCYPLECEFTEKAENIPLAAAATGFLFFRKKALTQIHNWMKIVEGLNRVVINDHPDSVESRVIPFFKDIVERVGDGKFFWRGEDTSFSYRAIQAGLKIRGCVTYSLGHEIPKVQFFTKPRRAPKVWEPSEIAVYAGNATVGAEKVLEAIDRLKIAKDCKVTVFCDCKTETALDSGMSTKRYEEFHAFDSFSTILLWGANTVNTIEHLQNPENAIVYMDKLVDKVPYKVLLAKGLLTDSQEIADRFSTAFPAEKISVLQS